MISNEILIGYYGPWKLRDAMKFYMELEPGVSAPQLFQFGRYMADGYASISSAAFGGVVHMNDKGKLLEISYTPENLSSENIAALEALAEKYFG